MTVNKLPSDVLRLHKGLSFTGITTVFYVMTKRAGFFWVNVARTPATNTVGGTQGREV